KYFWIDLGKSGVMKNRVETEIPPQYRREKNNQEQLGFSQESQRLIQNSPVHKQNIEDTIYRKKVFEYSSDNNPGKELRKD
ncbi:unnamed protein product, partial [marine sediment metagenome]